MIRYLTAIALLAAAGSACGQSRQDREAVETLPTTFVDAWARHDGRALAAIMADDVDFVTVGGAWFHGKSDFETYHSRLLSGRFRDARMRVLDRRVTFVRPDLGIVRWSWRMEGDKNADGTPRPPRAGLMTMLAEKRQDARKVIAAQNTNAGPGDAPELEGIVSPITLPKN